MRVNHEHNEENEGCYMEKKFVVPITDVKKIRVCCRRENCGAVVEIPIERLQLAGQITCQGCNAAMMAMPFMEGGPNGLRAIGLAIRSLSAENSFGVELVLPCE